MIFPWWVFFPDQPEKREPTTGQEWATDKIKRPEESK